MVTWGERRALLQPVVMRPLEGNKLELRGELLDPAVRLGALFKRGEYEVGECTPAAKVTLPHFAFVCKLDPGDERSWIQLHAWPPNRLLSTPVLDALVGPAGKLDALYERAPYAETREVADADTFTQAALAGVNSVRAKAGPWRWIPSRVRPRASSRQRTSRPRSASSPR